MLPRRTATALTALLTGAVLAGAPSAAHAETWSHRDAIGDVVTIGDDGTPTAAPTNRTADIRDVTITHTRKAVRVVARVHDLRRFDQVASVQFRAPGVAHASADLLRIGGGSALHAEVQLRGEDDRECDAASGSLRPHSDSFVMTFPRSCLARPDWVRVAVTYATFEDGVGNGGAVAGDDGLAEGYHLTARWSPRITVG